jgi:nucleotide-binding universal stress UspA family protein
VHRALADGIGAEVILEDGDVVEEVLKKAERTETDLVVMGNHGRRGFRRLLWPVTERVLRQSEAPVLSIPPSSPKIGKERGPFQRILCPVDFSSSLAGLSLGLALREGTRSLCPPCRGVLSTSAFGEAVAFDVTDLRGRHRLEGQAKLEKLVPEEARAHTRLETVVLESGSPYQEILKRAEREGEDLIVIGVSGRSSADLMFFGSTANHVVRAAACPVLTVRSSSSN